MPSSRLMSEGLELVPWVSSFDLASAVLGVGLASGMGGLEGGQRRRSAASMRGEGGIGRRGRRRSGAPRTSCGTRQQSAIDGASPTREACRRSRAAAPRARSSPRSMKQLRPGPLVAAERLDLLRRRRGSAAAGCPSSRSPRAAAPAARRHGSVGRSGGAGKRSSRYSRIGERLGEPRGLCRRPRDTPSVGTCASG